MRRLFRLAVGEHRPDLGVGRQVQAQELPAAVAHVEPCSGHRESVAGEQGGVVGGVDGGHLHVDLPVPGDAQREPVRRLGVLVCEQDRVARLQHQLARQLVQIERGELIADRRLHLDCAQRLDRDAPVLDLGPVDRHRRHRALGRAVGHDQLVAHLEPELTFHLLGE